MITLSPTVLQVRTHHVSQLQGLQIFSEVERAASIQPVNPSSAGNSFSAHAKGRMINGVPRCLSEKEKEKTLGH